MVSERFRRLFKEGSWVIIGQAMAVLGSLFGVKLLTGLLEPSLYGEIALGSSAAALAAHAIFGPLQSGGARFYIAAAEKDDLPNYLQAVRVLARAGTVVVLCISLVALFGLLLTELFKWAAMLVAFSIYAIISGYNATISGIQAAARQRVIVALHQGAETWVRTAVVIVLIIFLGASSSIAAGGYVLAAAVVLGSQYLFFRRTAPVGAIKQSNHDHSAPGSNWRRSIWSYSWPLAIWGVFSWAQTASDRWALGVFSTTKEVGLYAALYQLGYYPMLVATSAAIEFVAPILFQRFGDATNSDRIAAGSKLSGVLTAGALAFTALSFLIGLIFHSQIFRLFLGGEYAAVSYLLPWMLLASGLFAAGQTIALRLMSLLQTKTLIVPKILTAVFGIGLSCGGAYHSGIKGVVVAQVIFAATYFGWMLLLRGRIVRS